MHAEFNSLTEINGCRDVIPNFADWEMNASELEEILKKINWTKDIFGGVYPSDLSPLEVKQYPQSSAANVDTGEKPGTLWVAFYVIDDQHGEFFDSYGLPLHRYTKYVEDFLNTGCPKKNARRLI